MSWSIRWPAYTSRTSSTPPPQGRCSTPDVLDDPQTASLTGLMWNHFFGGLKGKWKLFSEDFGLSRVTRRLFLERTVSAKHNYIHLHCVVVEADISETDVSKPGLIQPKLSALDTARALQHFVFNWLLWQTPTRQVKRNDNSWVPADQVSLNFCILRLCLWDVSLWGWVAWMMVPKSDSTWDFYVGWIRERKREEEEEEGRWQKTSQ